LSHAGAQVKLVFSGIVISSRESTEERMLSSNIFMSSLKVGFNITNVFRYTSTSPVTEAVVDG
jgi:hypothetical protein